MVRMWDIQTGRCVRIMSGHSGAVHSLAVSDNGHIMASAGIIRKQLSLVNNSTLNLSVISRGR